MIQITNPKVAGFRPHWAAFSGFSLLFDHPAPSLSPWRAGLPLLDCRPTAEPAWAFYRHLAAFMQQLDLDRLTEEFLFCPLPPSTYHVTVWDGLNVGNAAAVPVAEQAALHEFLAALPESLPGETHFTAAAAQSTLSTSAWAIDLHFADLMLWGRQSLVVLLAPADAAAEAELARLVEARATLNATYRQQFNVAPADAYYPHVTLAYFANARLAAQAEALVPTWKQALQAHLGQTRLRFESLSLYGFSDMITFFKSI